MEYPVKERELLRMCLTALNTAVRFKIPALDMDSYQLASLLDVYFKGEKDDDKQRGI